MTIDYLREFIVLAELKNYSLAAEELYISASSLSKHIFSLEEKIGVKLFERTTRSVTLSEFGKMFIPYATNIVGQLDAFNKELVSAISRGSNTIRIASLPTLAQYGITELLASFAKKYPEITFQISELENDDITTYFLRDELDIAFMGHIPADANYIEVSMDHIMAVLPAIHPLAHEKKLRLEQLREDSFLLLDKNTGILPLCETAFAGAGFVPNIIYKGNRPENILRFVEKGMGVSLMLSPLIDFLNIKNIVCIEIDPPLFAKLYLIWNKKCTVKSSVKLFLGLFGVTDDDLELP